MTVADATAPGAQRRIVDNRIPGGIVRPVRGLVVHVIIGSLTGADSTFHNAKPSQPGGRRSATWGVGRDGTLLQWCEPDDVAWAQADGNRRWHSVETEGRPDEALTAAQLDRLAELFEWDSAREGYPLQLCDDPAGWGLGTHAMGGKAWGGHACPGPIRTAQRAAVVTLALERRHGPGPAPVVAGPPPVGPVHSTPTSHFGRRYMRHVVNVAIDTQGNGYQPTDWAYEGAIVQNRAIADPRPPPDGNGRYKIATGAGLDHGGKLNVVVMGADPSPAPPAAPYVVPVLVDIPD